MCTGFATGSRQFADKRSVARSAPTQAKRRPARTHCVYAPYCAGVGSTGVGVVVSVGSAAGV
ncbi:hypothetical protein B0B36_07270 [Pseudomonas syringae pv. actinidifoliorum]|nr:hypothetical protein B0B36_07270 [Pseudomonas syringae pv. actinidifoliorum]